MLGAVDTIVQGAERPVGSGFSRVQQSGGDSRNASAQGVEHYYFVRVHAPDGTSVAYLAPVWITGK